ncbi:MAG: hypothetical protein QS748_12615 [Candidatus Endonucleobacter bathymodioli]|uniref:Uncharacterized protein n=1 Tax=Candidatus Endonucleibacter bathymodioli TaxID=539814 RepID=A0AA90NT83_9GAMM|nr:hypothetical protein [Candidatus Endonucleobacter bathymodioli]
MNGLIKVVGFLFAVICFGTFSYGCSDPETFEDIGEQLKKYAYSAGEKTFNELAYGVTDEFITEIKDWLKKNGSSKKIPMSVHENEVDIEFIAFVCNGEMSYLALLIGSGEYQVMKRVNEICRCSLCDDFSVKCERVNSDVEKMHDSYYVVTKSQESKIGLKCSLNIYKIINKIAENISKHTGKKDIKIAIGFFYDVSECKWALNWHRDWWEDSMCNPDFLAFAVLDMNLPTKRFIRPHAQIALGLIDKHHEDLYGGTRKEMTILPSYEAVYEFVRNIGSEVVSLQVASCVQPLKELNNFTGSGYIVDQSMVRYDGKKIVHCRQERKYVAERLTMIARCFSACDANALKKDSEYQMITDIEDRNYTLLK